MRMVSLLTAAAWSYAPLLLCTMPAHRTPPSPALPFTPSLLHPERGGIRHPAPPPLRTFPYIGPLRVLRHITQGRHNRPEGRRVGFGKLKVPNEIVLPLVSVSVRGVHKATGDTRDACLSSQRMAPGKQVFLGVIAGQEKTLAVHPVHRPPGCGLVLRRHDAKRALRARFGRKRRRVGELGHGITRVTAGFLHSTQGLDTASPWLEQCPQGLFVAHQRLQRRPFKIHQEMGCYHRRMWDIARAAQRWFGAQELEATLTQSVSRGLAFHVIDVLHARPETVERYSKFCIGRALRQMDKEKTSMSGHLRREVEIGRLHVAPHAVYSPLCCKSLATKAVQPV